ncbi:hypothetical protein BaRGS_00003571 [Batillaria attramentaria]|uniref:Uncharacterized protein n=1 Tax=Batillaria attramentaria TaxID=370345 RepID=A0ABD0LZY8_9CAEN
MAEPAETNGAPPASAPSDYEKLIEEFEIQPETVEKLESLGITSLRSFSLLTPDLIDSNLSDISLGQRLLVKAAVESGSRLRRRQQQQDEFMGKSVVPTFTFDSTNQPPGTRYVVSVTTKDNQMVALPVTKETYEKCFIKGEMVSDEEDSGADYQRSMSFQNLPPARRRQRTCGPQALEHYGSQHTLQKIPRPDISRRGPRKRCHYCQKNLIRRDTRYYCPKCPGQPGLCRKGDCFTKYHLDEHRLVSILPDGNTDGQSVTKKCLECSNKGRQCDSSFHCPACPGKPGFCRTNNCFNTYHRSRYGENVTAAAHTSSVSLNTANTS